MVKGRGVVLLVDLWHFGYWVVRCIIGGLLLGRVEYVTALLYNFLICVAMSDF